ncbi:MAG: 3-hydroxybutyryl-CoA dehydrogenase [Peptostreptococcaceae bacterium]
MKVMVIGSGTMGCGIAQVLISKNNEVILRDLSHDTLEKGIKSIVKNLERSIEKGKLSVEEKNEMLKRISTTTDIKDASDCDLVIEAIVENMDIKKQLFKQLDHICKRDTILATNTSSLSISEIAMGTTRPEKVIGMHFFNPAPVMKLIEIIDTLFTSKETHETIQNLSIELEKNPVSVKEAPGFIVNRILIPMINEAIGIYADKVATVEDIDSAMKLGANHPIGPLALGDLIGLDVCLNIMEVLHKDFADDKYKPHPLLVEMVKNNQLGRKSNRGFYNYE